MPRWAHRVDGNDGPLDRHHVEQRRDGDDLVRLVCHLDLPEHEALACREGRNHMDRRLGAFLLVGAAQRLAVNGDHIGRRAGQRRHPGNEAPLKRLGIERRKNIAEVIVGGRPVTKRSEPAQQIDLLLAEPRDIHEGLRSAQNREQTQQQHLGERINDFAALARIGKSLK
jgi:hypothetical protein